MREASSWLKIPNTPHSSLNLSIILGFLRSTLYCIVIRSGESIHNAAGALVKSQKFANLFWKSAESAESSESGQSVVASGLARLDRLARLGRLNRGGCAALWLI